MAELPLDPAGTGLPLEPYGGRGCCGYGDGSVLQHGLHRFLDDERRTLPGHHAQVLELFGSSTRKRCVPCTLRDSLLDRGESRLYPGRTHWGVVFRTRIAAREPSGGHRFLRVGKRVGCSERGRTTAKVNEDSQGVILKGYDAVSYFKQGKPVKGNPEIRAAIVDLSAIRRHGC